MTYGIRKFLLMSYGEFMPGRAHPPRYYSTLSQRKCRPMILSRGFLAEWAAEYIPQQIGMLHAARLRKTRKGIYAGLGAVPSGYIVDYQKTSPTYRRFIIYELHARVVLWIFVRFYELEGNLLELCRELEAMPFVFPL